MNRAIEYAYRRASVSTLLRKRGRGDLADRVMNPWNTLTDRVLALAEGLAHHGKPWTPMARPTLRKADS